MLDIVAPELDATSMAEALWLASRMNIATGEADTGPVESPPTEERSAHGSKPEECGPRPGDASHDLHEHLTGAEMRLRGDAVSPSRAPGLPYSLEATRALRAWKRPWLQGRRSALNVEATVDGYACSGELIPVFTAAPERWFDLALVVDCSPAMQVWQETITDFTAVLNGIGAFRTLHVYRLHFHEGGPELRDGQGRPIASGRLRSPDGRRLVVVVSDCAAPGWRDAPVWRQLRDWALSSPVALLNPLPTKLWRRTGLDLPTTRVTAITPGSPNSRLIFQPPLLPYENDVAGDYDWLPISILSLSPNSLNRWSRTLMRTAPEGSGAVLVPRDGRLEQRPRQRSRTVAADRFLRTASPPAARLAVLCSAFDRLSTRLLHLVRQELVPEATSTDVAELLTSGLFTLGRTENGTVELTLPETVQRRLAGELAEHEVWRINRALSRHVASQTNWRGQLPSVVASPQGWAELPAAVQAFGQVSERTLELLGISPRGSAVFDRSEGAERDNRPYFFLSYARTPSWGSDGGDPDHWVHALFKDLCGHVMALTGLPAGSAVGFMDREMRSGAGWPEKLSESLATCRVFVPLFSPRYFSSETCGREWYAFAERTLHARSAGAATESAVVPALWTHVEPAELPDSVRHMHLDVSSFGSRYEAYGIYGLIKLRRFRGEYEETVLGLAERIVRAAHEAQLPPGRPRDYESTPSAFKPHGTGPRHVHLIVAAPTRDTVPDYRDQLPYGDDALDWNPYHSESSRPLSALAEDLIRSLDYRVTVSDFDDADISQTSGALEPEVEAPGILLIDQWALTDEERRRRLKNFDAVARPWVSAIVPRNGTDPQCRGEDGQRLAGELERSMPTILERARRGDSRIAVNGVATLNAFTNVLPAVVAHITRQYLKHAEARLPQATPRPRLRESVVRPPETATNRGEDSHHGENEPM